MLISDLDLDNLVDGQEMVVVHPYIDGLKLVVRRSSMDSDVLGVAVTFYGDSYVLVDTDGDIHNGHDVEYDSYQMSDYVNRLCETKTIEMFRYVKTMERYGLREGDVVEFHNGSRGKVILPDFKIYANNVLYVPIKKDGTLSKVKPRMLYGNVPFKIIR